MKNKCPQPRTDRRNHKPSRAPRPKTTFRPSRHAAERYMERFEGNITVSVARERLVKLAGKAHAAALLPGGAREYRAGNVRLVVADHVIVTVYRGFH